MPDLAQTAVNIFNMLGDRVAVDIGYLGKDYSYLPVLLKSYHIENIELFLDVLHWLDSRAIEKSAEHMKRERDKLKKKK